MLLKPINGNSQGRIQPQGWFFLAVSSCHIHEREESSVSAGVERMAFHLFIVPEAS
jgi:hypothetical protein